jgi:hypothetical protein
LASKTAPYKLCVITITRFEFALAPVRVFGFYAGNRRARKKSNNRDRLQENGDST